MQSVKFFLYLKVCHLLLSEGILYHTCMRRHSTPRGLRCFRNYSTIRMQAAHPRLNRCAPAIHHSKIIAVVSPALAFLTEVVEVVTQRQ